MLARTEPACLVIADRWPPTARGFVATLAIASAIVAPWVFLSVLSQREGAAGWHHQVLAVDLEGVAQPVAADHRPIGGDDLDAQVVQLEFIADGHGLSSCG